jgi:hypothetical protein
MEHAAGRSQVGGHVGKMWNWWSDWG